MNVSRDIPACRALFIHSIISQEKDKKKSTKNLMEICHVKLIMLFEVIAREHARDVST